MDIEEGEIPSDETNDSFTEYRNIRKFSEEGTLSRITPLKGFKPSTKHSKKIGKISHFSEHSSKRSNYDYVHDYTKRKRHKRKSKSARMKSLFDHRSKNITKETVLSQQNKNYLLKKLVSKSAICSVPSATVTQPFQHSLMNKLITAGLAKTQSSVLDIQVQKQSNTLTPKAEETNEDDDSEIEVITPPKKVPPVVTLDSDGEELEVQVQECAHESSVEIINLTGSVENLHGDMQKSENEESVSLLSCNKGYSSDNVSVKCLDSDEVPYTPSSPSSCNSLVENEKQNPELSVESCHTLEVEGNCSNNSHTSQEVTSARLDQYIPPLKIPKLTFGNQISVYSDTFLNNDTEKDISTTCHSDNSSNEQLEPCVGIHQNVEKDYSSGMNISAKEDILSKQNKLNVLNSNTLRIKSNKNNEECILISDKNCNIKSISSEKNLKRKDNSYTNVEVNRQASSCADVSNKSQESDATGTHNVNSITTEQISIIENISSIDKATVNIPFNYCDKKTCDSSFEILEESTNATNNNIGETLEKNLDLTNAQEVFSPLPSYGSKNPLNIDQSFKESSTVKENLTKDVNAIQIEKNHLDLELRTFLSTENEKFELEENTLCDNILQSDDEEDISKLRLIALSTKGKSNQNLNVSKENNNLKETVSQSNTSADDDDYENEEEEVLQLRVAALKSAVIKKHEERKKRGLMVKKRKRGSSGNVDDFAIPSLSGHEDLLSENSMTSKHNELECPRSPETVQGEEDMEIDSDSIGDIIENNNIQKAPQIISDSSTCQPSLPNCDTRSDTSFITYIPPSIPLIPPQPLPPGVDIDYAIICRNESQSQNLCHSTQFPPVLPPPPPPPSLLFPSLLVPPPPPPPPPPPSPPTTCLDTSLPLQLKGSTLDPLPVTNTLQLSVTSNPTYHIENVKADANYSEVVERNEESTSDFLSSKQSFQSQHSKCSNSSDINVNQLRPNLKTIPVLKNLPKKMVTKKIPKKLRKRGKKSKMLNKLKTFEPELLCITNTPASFKSKNKINFKSNKQCNFAIKCTTDTSKEDTKLLINHEKDNVITLCTIDPSLEDNNRTCTQNPDSKDLHKEDIYSDSIDLNTCSEKLTDSNSLEDKSYNLDDEMDLSDMIVLDEVGPESPECKTRIDVDKEYSTAREKDEEDEDTLRVQALTSLSMKTIPIKRNTAFTVPPKSQAKCKSPYHRENYNNRPNLYSREEARLKLENVPMAHRKNINNDLSKYKLNRVVCNEPKRSVVRERESLKVVIPSQSPQLSLLPEASPPMTRFVINVGPDSDSEEEVEWMRRVHIQENPGPPPQVNLDLERSIDLLLMNARQKAGKSQPPPVKQDQTKCVALRPNRCQTPDSKEEEDSDLLDTPLRLLPKKQQEEYQRLKKIIEESESKKKFQQKRVIFNKEIKKSSIPLQHVLTSEASKHKLSTGEIKLISSSKHVENVTDTKGSSFSVACNNSQKQSDHRTKIEHTNKECYENKSFIEEENDKSTLTNNRNIHSSSGNQTESTQTLDTFSDMEKEKKISQFTTKVKDFCFEILESCSTENGNDTIPKSSTKKMSPIDPDTVSCPGSECLNAVNIVEGTLNDLRYKPLVSADKGAEGKNNNTEILTDDHIDASVNKGEIFSSSSHTDTSQCESQNNASSNHSIEKTLVTECHDESMELSTIPTFKDMGLEDITQTCKDHGLNTSKIMEKSEMLSENNGVGVVTHKTLDSVNNTETNVPCDNKIKNDINLTKLLTHVIQKETCNSDEESGTAFEGQTSKSVVSEEEVEYMKSCSMEMSVINTSSFKTASNKPDICSDQKKSTDSEILHSNQLELLNERFILIDELTNMSEAMAQLEREKLQLDEVVAGVSRLRKALRQAETRLSTLHAGTQQLQQNVNAIQQAVTTRYSHIQHLEDSCLHLGHQLHGTDYEMPPTGKELVERKMKLVAEKRNKINAKRKEIKAKRMTLKHPTGLHSKLSQTNNGQTNILPVSSLVTPGNTCAVKSSTLCAPLSIEDEKGTDSTEQEALSFPLLVTGKGETKSPEPEIISSQTSKSGDFSETCPPAESAQSQLSISENTLLNVQCPQKPTMCHISLGNLESLEPKKHSNLNATLNQKTKETFPLKCPINNVISDLSKVVCQKKLSVDQTETITNVQREEINENVPFSNIKNSTTKPSQRSVPRYKSLLRYRSSVTRTVSNAPSSTEAILCPFDLSGKCQDTQCLYLHLPE
uniref:Putative zinc-finger domain-containing protein n=1 Tax=Cuerna arida TaxID=1464854 RepID=A0A1B6GAH8_9HEMI